MSIYPPELRRGIFLFSKYYLGNHYSRFNKIVAMLVHDFKSFLRPRVYSFSRIGVGSVQDIPFVVKVFGPNLKV